MTEWNRDFPAIEKQKREAFDHYIDQKLADMVTRIDALLLKCKKTEGGK